MLRKKQTVVIGLLIAVLLIGVVVFLVIKHNKANTSASTSTPVPIVTVQKVSELQNTNTFNTVGTVEAVSEADLQTEAGGQITATYVQLGDTVAAGQILATIENGAQSAALQQAEGSYEAAQAGAASSQVSVSSAQTALASAYTAGISTYKSNYISVEAVLHNDIDTLFTITNGKYTGLKIDGRGQANTLNDERNALEPLLLSWQQHTNTVSNSDLASSIEVANDFVTRVADFVDSLSTVVNQDEVTTSFTDTQKTALKTMLSGDKAALNASLLALSGAHTSLISAQKALEQAELAGSATTSSASSAQIKIALGVLNAAKTNYEKTIVRTPIAGVINALYIKKGDYVSASQKAAVVANNNGLEITTSVGQDDASHLSVGDNVKLEDNGSGVVTAIAPALDPATGKVQVKVSVDTNSKLVNGSTVSVTFTQKNQSDTAMHTFNIPLTALKITASGPVAFTVAQDMTLTAVPVTLGSVNGDFVAITDGLTDDAQIVTDARGLKAGQTVTLK